MPGTPPTRGKVGWGDPAQGEPIQGDWADDDWDDAPRVADRNVVRFTDREIETMVAAVALGVIGAAVLAGFLALNRRRPGRK